MSGIKCYLCLGKDNVGFAELEVVIKGIVGKNQRTEGGSDLQITPPIDKMNKNNFNAHTQEKIAIGLIKAPEVSKFLNSMSGIDMNFSERLKNVIFEKYQSLKDGGVENNEIFNELEDFCTIGEYQINYKAAGLSVLVYFFQSCEIFEK